MFRRCLRQVDDPEKVVDDVRLAEVGVREGLGVACSWAAPRRSTPAGLDNAVMKCQEIQDGGGPSGPETI